MMTVRVQVGRNRTSRATAEIEHRGADGKGFSKTVVPGPFVPTAASAVGLKGQGVLLVVADDAIGRIAHVANLVPTFRSSCSIAAPTLTNFEKSWATHKLMILVPLYRSEVPDRIRRLWCRDFRSAVLAAVDGFHEAMRRVPRPRLIRGGRCARGQTDEVLDLADHEIGRGVLHHVTDAGQHDQLRVRYRRRKGTGMNIRRHGLVDVPRNHDRRR